MRCVQAPLPAHASKVLQDATLSPSRLSSSRGAAPLPCPPGRNFARSPLGLRGKGRSSSKQQTSPERQEQAGTSGPQRPTDGQGKFPERPSAHKRSQKAAHSSLASPKGFGRRSAGFSPRGKSAKRIQQQGSGDRQSPSQRGTPAEKVPKTARRRLMNRERSRDHAALAQASSLALLSTTDLLGCITALHDITRLHTSSASQHCTHSSQQRTALHLGPAA